MAPSSRFIRLLVFAGIFAVISLLSACEEEDRDAVGSAIATTNSPPPDSQSSPNVTTRDSVMLLEEHREEGGAVSSGSILRLSTENQGLPDRYFPLTTPIFVDASIFLQTNGTYAFGDRVFADCDELGFYLLTVEPAGMIRITNCATDAFP